MTTGELEYIDLAFEYRRINTFFDNYTLAQAVRQLNHIIKAATTPKASKQNPPYGLIFYMQHLAKLTNAACTLYYNFNTRPERINPSATGHGDPDLSLHTHFIASNRFSTVWNSLPRSLTSSQYHDPYRAIGKFANRRSVTQWQVVLNDFTEYALSNCSIHEALPPYDILDTLQQLLRLVEACHLIHVRHYLNTNSNNIISKNAGDIKHLAPTKNIPEPGGEDGSNDNAISACPNDLPPREYLTASTVGQHLFT